MKPSTTLSYISTLQEENEDLRSEVEKLREALRTIASQTDEEWTLELATEALDV